MSEIRVSPVAQLGVLGALLALVLAIDRARAAGDPPVPEDPVDVVHRTKVKVVVDALDANNTIARANRDDFDRHGVAVVNLMSAPGAGKTRLLERALDGLDGVRAGVLEGDVAGSFDADRLSLLHIPVVQLNTGAGFGGECHLDANMVRSAHPGAAARTSSTCWSSRTSATSSARRSSASARTRGSWSAPSPRARTSRSSTR